MRQAAALDPLERLILDRYRPLRPLGRGGSGSVWLARDEIDAREVALKVVPREGKSGSRAEREAEAVAKLRHRRCARVYHVQRDARHVYIAYEYVPGKTLREAMQSGELDDARAVEAAAQVLEALAHAHHRGVLHRDVKPANVLLADASGGEVSVRLLDFGLAQLEEADTLTAAGDVPGTLAYIAPERLDGHDATGAADVWGVGVLLWEALAGYHPFWSASPVELARRIGAGASPIAKARPDLPASLARAVDRALAPDPRRRPAPKRLAMELRASREEAAARRSRRPLVSRRVVLERAPHAGLAAAFTALATSLFTFFPAGWTPALAGAAALVSLLSPRGGLCLALAAPVLPLGDVSLGLAAVYGAFALAWAALAWREPRHGLLAAAGPLLALGGALALVPLVAERAPDAVRRALQAAAAVVLATLVAGLRGSSLPFSGDAPPLGLGIAGSDDPVAVAGALWRALAAQPAIAVEAVVVGVTAAALPYARRHGLTGAAVIALAFLTAALAAPVALGFGGVSTISGLVGAAGLALALAFPSFARRRGRAGAGGGEGEPRPYNDPD
jgi:hypothetical protein